MAKGFADLSGDIDALYQGPLGEFTAGRNALEKRVKAEQGKEAAAAIKALEKPSVSAWAVNQLYWRYPNDFERLLRAGDDLRASQQKRMAGRDVDVNAAIDARREALSKLMGRAAAILEEGGTASDDIRQRVGQTLEALSVYGTNEAAPRPGRLTADVQPPGFAALAALVPAGRPAPAGKAKSAPGREDEAGAEAGERDGDGQAAAARGKKGPAAPPPRPMESKRAEKARLALEQAEVELARARDAEEEAAAAQATAQKEWEAAKAALDDIQQKLDEAMDREKSAHTHRDEQRRAATQAAHAASRAERARNEAERYLQSLARG
jgi:hypothetical protein